MAVVWIAFAGIVTDGLFVWPLHTVLAAGQNAEFSLLAAAAWGMLVAVLNPVREPQAGIWRWIFRALNTVGAFGLMILDAIMVTELSGMLQSFYYFDTPRWALSTPLIVIVVSAALRRGNVPWRIVGLWVPVLASGAAIILGISFSTVHHLRPLLPNQAVNVMGIIHATGVIAFIGLAVGMTLRMVTVLAAEPPRWTWRLAAIEVPIVFFMFLYVIAMGALGPEALVQVRWPLVFVLDHVTLDSTFFLSRIGILVILTWTVGIGLGLIVHLRLTQWVAKDYWPKASRWAPVAVGGWWWAVGMLISSPHSATQIVLYWINPAVAAYLGVEFVVLVASRIFMRPTAQQQPSPSTTGKTGRKGSVPSSNPATTSTTGNKH